MVKRTELSLAMLQHADSAFPSGAISFSWGLETLVNGGVIAGATDVSAFLNAQITGRWANIDRPMMLHAHEAGTDTDRLTTLDALVEAQSLAAELRQGSRRMGLAFLAVHVRLNSSLAKILRQRVAAKITHGHIPIMQGAIWKEMGFSPDQAQAMAAHGLCTGVLGAAVRLSVIGHVDAQTIYGQLQPRIAAILHSSICAPSETHGFTPQIEIASMLHETDQMRLFVN